MDAVVGLIDPVFWVLVFGITLVGGFVKGAIGIAMPMIMISGFGSFMSPELALAGLIVPTVLSNVMQTLRGGLEPAIASAIQFRRYIVILLVVIVLSAQMVRILAPSTMFLIVGIPIVLISLTQILGWKPHIRPEIRSRVEATVAILAGAIGGVSGVWGPPTTIYLTAIDTPKEEQIRVQGVIFGVGAVALFFAHLNSGILNAQTVPFSMIIVVPAAIGMMIGFRFQDRLDQQLFRKLTLAVLVIAGLNLIRRGLMG